MKNITQLFIDLAGMQEYSFLKEDPHKVLDENTGFTNLFHESTTHEADLLANQRSTMEKLEREQYEKETYKIWGKSFEYYDTISYFVYDARLIYQRSDEYQNGFPLQKNKLRVIEFLLARAYQQYHEVGCLMRGAYPEGAIARARSIMELSYVARFLSINDDSLSEEYLKSHNQNNMDWAKKAPCFSWKKDKDHVSIANIRDEAFRNDKSIQKKFYEFSCLPIHGSPKGTFDRCTYNFDPTGNTIDVGQSVIGIQKPAKFASGYFVLLCDTYFSLIQCNNVNVIRNVIILWYKMLIKELSIVSKSLTQSNHS